MQTQTENKYDKDIVDTDELDINEIKVNPDFYIHNALIKAQASLDKDNLKEGLIRYQLFIEQVELLSIAAEIMPNDYDKQISEYKTSNEYTGDLKEVKLAHKKLALLTKALFSRKVMTHPLKY